MFSTVIRSCARQVGRSLTKNRSSVKGCGKSYSTTTYSHAMRAGKTYTDAKVVFSTIALGSGLIIGTSTLLNRRFPKIAIAEEERPTLLKSHGTRCATVTAQAYLSLGLPCPDPHSHYRNGQQGGCSLQTGEV